MLCLRCENIYNPNCNCHNKEEENEKKKKKKSMNQIFIMKNIKNKKK